MRTLGHARIFTLMGSSPDQYQRVPRRVYLHLRQRVCIPIRMDDWSEALGRVVLVANRKGGVGKSSLCRSIAHELQQAGYRVAVLDGDPQGDLSEIDFGLETDRGRGLAMALQYGATPLAVQTTGGVDVVCGGPDLLGVVGAASAAGSEVDLVANLRSAVGQLCAENKYDLLLIDSPPGETILTTAYLFTARWLVVPTISDEASFAAVDKMGARYADAKRKGAEVEFLGAVLTMVAHQATARNKAVRQELTEALGSAASPFEAMIRHNPANAVDARRHGLAAGQVAAQAETQRTSRLARLKDRAAGRKVPPESDEAAWWSRSSGAALAGDYEALTREILIRIRDREGAEASA